MFSRPNLSSGGVPTNGFEPPRFDHDLASKLMERSSSYLPQHMREVEQKLSAWITRLLDLARPGMRSLSTFEVPRLEDFFPRSLLESTMVGVVPRCPELPLRDLGLESLGMPSGSSARGITLRDTFFVTRGSEKSPRLHFHETVHVVQWIILGEQGFLLTYGAGLIAGGYVSNPLEIMAYDLDEQFSGGCAPFDVVKEVHQRLKNLALTEA